MITINDGLTLLWGDHMDRLNTVLQALGDMDDETRMEVFGLINKYVCSPEGLRRVREFCSDCIDLHKALLQFDLPKEWYNNMQIALNREDYEQVQAQREVEKSLHPPERQEQAALQALSTVKKRKEKKKQKESEDEVEPQAARESGVDGAAEEQSEPVVLIKLARQPRIRTVLSRVTDVIYDPLLVEVSIRTREKGEQRIRRFWWCGRTDDDSRRYTFYPMWNKRTNDD